MKCAMFDKDGTLLDFDSYWIPIAVKAVEEICSPYNINTTTKQKILDSIGIGEHVSISGVLCYGTYKEVTDAIYEAIRDAGIECSKYYIECRTMDAFRTSASAGKLIATSTNLKSTLAKLKKAGFLLCVVTSDEYESTVNTLKKLDLYELFDEVLTADPLHKSKPDPYYINYIQKKYSLKKEDMCMVGDTPLDMQFARNGGIRAFGVGKDLSSRLVLDQYADVTAKDVETLYN